MPQVWRAVQVSVHWPRLCLVDAGQDELVSAFQLQQVFLVVQRQLFAQLCDGWLVQLLHFWWGVLHCCVAQGVDAENITEWQVEFHFFLWLNLIAASARF